MKLLRYVVKRLIWLIPVLLGISIITFVISRVLPGDPVFLILGSNRDPVIIQETIARLGLDKPMYLQYVKYLQNVMKGDLGMSFLTNNPVLQDLTMRLPATLEIVILSLALSVVIGVALGVVSGIKKDGVIDHLTRGLSLFGVIMPSFWVGLLFIYVFFYKLKIAPAPMGRVPMSVNFNQTVTGFMLIDTLLAQDLNAFCQAARQMVLPVVTLTISTIAPIARLTRSSMIQTLKTEYIRMSRASGLPAGLVYLKYSLKNCLLPLITSIGLTFSYSIGGVVLVEKVFTWPGVGLYAVQAISMMDYNAIQGFVMLSALCYIVVFLVVDLLYFMVDPRIRY